MKPIYILLTLLFAFVLTACGGGGGGSDDTTMMPDPGSDTMPMPTTHPVTLPDGVDATEGTEEIMAGSTATIGDITFTCPAGGDACSVMVAADGTATSTGGAATAAESQASLDSKAAAAKAEQDRINVLTMAIADPDGDGDFPEDNELSNRRPGENIHLMSGGRISVGGADFASGDELGENDGNIRNSEEFQDMSESRIALHGDYKASVYQRTKSGKTDTLTIYSNVEAAGSTPFNDFTWPTGLTAGAEGDTQPTGGERMIYDVITFDTSSDSIASGTAGKMTGARIPPSAGTNRTTDNGDSFSGTLYGVPGKYSCSGTGDCTLTRNDDGVLAVTGGTFTFTANPTNTDTEDDHVILGSKPDTDYLVFGYWLQKSTGDRYGVGVFAEGSVPFDYATTTLADLDGTATYDGSATGMYALKALAIVDGKVVGTPAEAGQFSANVSLTAHFGSTGDGGTHVNGSDRISAAEAFTISGMVDNFQNAAGDTISDWALNLNAADIDGLTATSRMFSDDTGKGDLMGQWSGAFYGSPVNAPTGDSVATDNYPSSVAGEFTGHFSDGHVIGSFGASTD